MWTKEDTAKLHQLAIVEKKTYNEMVKILGKTYDSIKHKLSRTNWDLFFKNNASTSLGTRTWSMEEMLLLHTWRSELNKSYKEISKKLGRTPNACENAFKKTDWIKFFDSQIDTAIQANASNVQCQQENNIQNIATHMVNLSRHNIDVLDEMQKSFFLKKSGMQEEDLPIDFKEIKKKAKTIMNKMGLCFPTHLQLPKGTYIIVGDSHGKHTKRHNISLIKNVAKQVKAKNIIHVGHFLDDDDEASYCWNDFNNLIVLAKREELQTLSAEKRSYKIVRHEIEMGDLSVCNQDEISDYTNTFIGNLKKQVFPTSTVVNSHRHEMETRTTSEDDSTCQLFSPGCLCEPHIVRTIKQINFEEGKMQVKLAYWDGFSKYRRMRHRYVFWEQGLLVVHVGDNNTFDVIGCRIFKTSKGYTTSYFDKIITENSVLSPNKKIFFNGDAHVLHHDINILDLQEQFCDDYKPDVVVNLGDVANNEPLNHHQMSKNGWAIPKSILAETAGVHYVLQKMRKWSKEFYLIYGNHERFSKDFVNKLPQFKDLLDFSFITNLKALNIELIPHKNTLRIDGLKLMHGDLTMFRSRGQGKLEKAAHVFGNNVVIGDVHYPSARFGCYSVGLTGKIDQEYNEPMATSWLNGLGFCNIFEDKCFISVLSISNNRFTINNKQYKPKKPKTWQVPDFQASVHYDFAH